MVAHGRLHVLHAQQAVGLHPQGHHLSVGIAALSPGNIAVHAVGVAVEELPHTGVTDTAAREVGLSVGSVVAEVLVLALVPAHQAGIRDHVLRPQHRLLPLLLLLHGHEACDAALVGVAADHVVGHAASHPYRASQLLQLRRLQRSLHRVGHPGPHHLHNPRLVGVADSKRLALRAVAVLLYQLRHHRQSLARRLRALQSYVDERAVVDDARRVHHFLATAEGRLANGHLPLVDVTHHVVRLRRLRYLSQILVRVPLINLSQLARLMLRSRIVVQVHEGAVGVGVVAADDRAVGRSLLAHDKVCAGPALSPLPTERSPRQGQRNKE